MIHSVAIIAKNGRLLIVRRFTHAKDSNIEGHLGAFPQLVKNSGHNYIDTETARLVYQETNDLYVIITVSKDTNIIEALDTVMLFVDVTRSICGEIVEDKIIANAIDLIFAYDECIFDGFTRNVVASDVTRFLKMQSATEEAYLKELEAKVAHQRELIKAHEATTKGKPVVSSQTYYQPTEIRTTFDAEPAPKPSTTPKTTGMQLGLGKKSHREIFKAQVMAEEGIATPAETETPQKPQESNDFQIQFEEKFNAVVNHSGTVSELLWDGRLYAISNSKCKIQIALEIPESNNFLMKPMQQADKKMFTNSRCLIYDNITTGFHPGVRGAILGWKRNSQSAEDLPFSVEFWFTNGSGSTTCSCEATLNSTDKDFSGLKLQIPIENMKKAEVSAIDGEYEINFDRASGKSYLLWTISEFNKEKPHAEIEFSLPVVIQEELFFPVIVNFSIPSIFCQMDVTSVTSVDDGEAVKYSITKSCVSNKFEYE